MRTVLELARPYLVFSGAANLAWEIVQLPLYSIRDDGLSASLLAVLHCTLGDLAISAACLSAAALVSCRKNGSIHSLRRMVLVTVALGIGYTVFSEWRNVHVTHAWSYSQWMPTIPPLGTGLAPILQWLVLPLAGFKWSLR